MTQIKELHGSGTLNIEKSSNDRISRGSYVEVMRYSDPFSEPDWMALHRESLLVSQIIGSGVTALGRASYGDRFGEYYTAFFGLSIGTERLAKLILVADYAMNNGGSLPSQRVVRGHGHDIKSMIEEIEAAAKGRGIKELYSTQGSKICAAIVECLDAFASASKGRYANFEAIGNPAFNPADEPVEKWWTEVVEPILDLHYRGTRAEQDVINRSAMIDLLMGRSAIVRYADETGKSISDISSAVKRSEKAAWAQKYGRFYTLCVARRLAYIFCEVTNAAVRDKNIHNLRGHGDIFLPYIVEDDYMKRRKTWPSR